MKNLANTSLNGLSCQQMANHGEYAKNDMAQ